jgi:nucleoside-diphosphate-sugar epimerase
MKVLVTGGAGYIGSTLVPLLLRQGHQVRVFDSLRYGGRSMMGFWGHPRFEFLNGDLCDPRAVGEAVQGVEAVVHLAAIVGDPACAREPDLARQVNVNGSLFLLEKSMQAGVVRFVFASTCSNYGRMADPSQYADETWELRPLSLYAETKVAVEESVFDLSRADFTATVLRFATVYGVSPRMRFDLTVNEFTLEMVAGRRLVVFGQDFWRPYVHVGDVAQAQIKVPEEIFQILRITFEWIKGT